MIQIIEQGITYRTVIATAETFEAAKAKVVEMGAAHMEDDADYVDCADAYMHDGRCIAIQPADYQRKEA